MSYTILCPTDFSDASKRALEYVIENFAHGDAEVCLLHVDELPTFGLPEGSVLDEPMRRRWREQIDRLVAEYRGRARLRATSRRGNADEEILAEARESKADLIVMATRGRSGLTRALLGAVTHKVVRAAQVPVLTIDPDAELGPIRSILCPIDFSDASKAALAEAVRIAERRDATVHLIHALRLPADYTFPDGTSFLETSLVAQQRAAAMEQLNALRTELGSSAIADADVLQGAPHLAIRARAEARKPDLIVMGTHGRTGYRRLWMGSVAERTLRSADVPVMVVHGAPRTDSPEDRYE